MQALYDFIIEPKGDRYNNSVKVEDKSLILNTEVYNHQYVNREATVVAIPLNYDGEVKVGDTIIVHHNVFRRWHNIRGEEKNSRGYFEDNKYLLLKIKFLLTIETVSGNLLMVTASLSL